MASAKNSDSESDSSASDMTECYSTSKIPLEHTISSPSSSSATTSWEANVPDLGSLHRDFSKLLRDENTYDLILKVGDKELRAHRDILTAQSRVFDVMLNQIVGKNNSIIALPDCNAQALEQFLSYVYYGKVETLDPSNMLSLYYVADKYDVQGLKDECSDFIKKSLSVQNLCDIIQLAVNHSDCSLLECAVEYFHRNPLEVFESDHWKSFLQNYTQLASQIIIKVFRKSSKYSQGTENQSTKIHQKKSKSICKSRRKNV